MTNNNHNLIGSTNQSRINFFILDKCPKEHHSVHLSINWWRNVPRERNKVWSNYAVKIKEYLLAFKWGSDLSKPVGSTWKQLAGGKGADKDWGIRQHGVNWMKTMYATIRSFTKALCGFHSRRTIPVKSANWRNVEFQARDRMHFTGQLDPVWWQLVRWIRRLHVGVDENISREEIS